METPGNESDSVEVDALYTKRSDVFLFRSPVKNIRNRNTHEYNHINHRNQNDIRIFIFFFILRFLWRCVSYVHFTRFFFLLLFCGQGCSGVFVISEWIKTTERKSYYEIINVMKWTSRSNDRLGILAHSCYVLYLNSWELGGAFVFFFFTLCGKKWTKQ